MLFLNPGNTCPTYISSYILDLTSSYTDKRNESTIVSASVIMFVLVGLFFNLSLFSGVSDVSAILDPKVRLFLSSMLSLFLPVMSYLFSEAKNAGSLTRMSRMTTTDLSLRAGLILTWMLMVELLRKKVDEIHMQSYSGIIQRAARVIWLGNLVFFNVSNIGRQAFFSVLWILCATKLVQRIAFTEAGKHSYAHGRNARLIRSYMAQMLQHDNDIENDYLGTQAVNGENELLRRCKYIVMGEERLVEEPTANGYKLDKNTLDNITSDSDIITVGKVWELAKEDNFYTTLDRDQHLKRLCLSFALFKLLRQRFERLPAETNKETQNSRALILKGLYNNGESTAVLFEVIKDEVTFLSEYYHSVIPVALASPFFLFVNYFLLHIVVVMLCLMTIVICGNGGVNNVFSSIDLGTLQSGFADVTICLLSRAAYSPAAFFSIVDLSVTIFLFIIFFYEEIWEFLVFLLSNWFLVSLLCNHMGKPHRRDSRTFSWAVRIIMWLRSKIIPTNISFKQFSVLNLCWPPSLQLLAIPSLVVKTELVPDNLKRSIIEHLVEPDPGTTSYNAPLTNGVSALRRNNLLDQLSWACNRDSISEVILTWHIATSIMEVKCAPQSQEEAASSRVAIRLSKYCAYLVAFHPKLLPDDNQEKAELVFQEVKKELKGILGCRGYYLFSQRTRVEKIMETMRVEETNEAAVQSEIQEEYTGQDDEKRVLMNGAKLSRSLMAVANNNQLESVWKVLADVWTELIVFMSPSSDEEHLRGHEDVLARGGEFITVLWALATHSGITRSANIS